MIRKLGIVSFSVGVLALATSAQFAIGQAADTGLPARPVVTQNIDESQRIALGGNTHPQANAANDRGAVADDFPMEHMLLQLRRSPQQEQALQQLIGALHDKDSPAFHQWLSAQEFGERFGVAQSDLDAVTGWLESHGFRINVVYRNRMLIDFSGTAGQVREAFQAEIHFLDVNGQRHIANMSDPRIPAAVAPVVSGVVSLHDFRPHPMHVLRGANANYTFPGSLGGTNYAMVPADLATIYNLNPLFSAGLTGQGQTIALIEDTDVFSTADWSTFRSTFGLSTYTSGSFTTVHPAPPSGSNNCTSPGAFAPNDAEAILDAEWASASAPNAAILMASCADAGPTFGGLIAFQNLINASSQPPAIISISYGQCEPVNGAAANAAYNSAYQQAVAEGVSVFVAAGDSGAAGCDNNVADATHGIAVNAFASTPYNVAVGGTDFSDTFSGTNTTYWNSTNTAAFGSAKSYIPEIPWNDSCAGALLASALGFSLTYGPTSLCNDPLYGPLTQTTVAGGGGPSGCAMGTPSISGVVSGSCQGWAKPSWQSVLGNPIDGVRDTPDISLFAADGAWSHFYVFCWSDTAHGGAACAGNPPSNWSGAGGTSFASPIMAGIQALVNQKTGARQGNPNPVYYQLAAAEYGTAGSSACNSSKGNAVSSTCIFYDVTLGDMDVNCTGNHSCFLDSSPVGVLSTSNNAFQPAYGTNIGWDFATGIGTINAANLVNNWLAPSLGPTLNTISPSSGQRGQTINNVVLTGTNLSGATINPLNGITVSNVATTANQVKTTFAIAASAPLGAQYVSVTTANGTSNAVTFTVNAASTAPTLSSISPASNVQGAIVGVTLTGTNFVAGANINVSASGVTPSGVTVVNSTTITATFAIATNATTGAHTVSVTTAGGTSGAVTFTVNAAPGAPTLSAPPSPQNLAQGNSYLVTLTGTNFVAGNTAINISWTGLTVTNPMVLSSTSMTATFTVSSNSPVGSATFTVSTPFGTSGTRAFNIIGVPIINTISPNNANPGASLTVTLSGSQFFLAQIQISGTGITATNRKVTSGYTQLTYTFTIATNATPGARTVTVSNGAGTSNGVTFTVNGSVPAPTLSTISPTSGQTGQVVSPVNLTGTNLSGATINAPTGITPSGVSSTATTVTATFTIAANAPTGAQNVTVTTAGGTSNAVTFTVNQAPAITSASSATFVVGAAGTFTVTTTAFPTPSLTESGALPSPVTFHDNGNGTGTLSGTPAAGTGGTYNITFTAANGVGSNAVQSFRLTVNQAPAITSANSATFTVGQAGSFTVTTTGNPTPSITESGALPAGPVTFHDNGNGTGTLIGTPGASGSGTYSITFTGANGVGSNAVQNFTLTVTVPLPTLTSLTTTHALPGISGGITLTGTNFYAPATINASGTGLSFTGVNVLSSTSITATFAVASNAPPGPQNVSVTTPGGTSGSVIFTVDQPAPTLTSISPSSGIQGNNVSVTLTGTNFTTGATINFTGGGVTVSNTAVVNSTTITATLGIAANAATGTQYVSVATSGGTSGNVTFIVNPPGPTLGSISPASGLLGTNVNVTLTGTGFVSGATINYGGTGVTISSTTVVNSTTITATFQTSANAGLGAQNVSVTTAGGTTGTLSFTVNAPPPTLTSLTTTHALPGISGGITLTGTNFYAPATINASGTGLTFTGVNVLSSTSITATFAVASNAPPGPQNVSVTTPGGTSGPLTFTVDAPAPTLTSISPSSSLQGVSVNVTLTGTNFISGAAINFTGAGVTVSNTVVVNATTITATFAVAANAATGTQYVSVTTGAGTSGFVSFIVNPPPPTLTGISPSSGVAGTAVGVTLTGTGFVAGQTTISSSVQAILVTNVTVVSSTQITATFNIAADAAKPSSLITVLTPNGTSGAQTFNIYHVPTLTSISPNSGTVGTNVTVTLTGTNFVSPATVNFSGAGVTVTNVTVVNTTTITATFQISAGAATGAQNVSVTTPGGNTAVAVFTVN